MKTVEIYSFDELDEATQKKVIQRYYGDVSEALGDFINDDFLGTSKAICEQLGLKTIRGSYAQFELSDPSAYEYVYLKTDNRDEDGYDIYNDDSYESVVAWLNDKKQGFKYQDDLYFTGAYSDGAVCDYINKVLSGEEQPQDIDEFLSKLSRIFDRAWEDEFTYGFDDDTIAETIIANDWEFTADGKRV
jgi:hypothetical protein